MTRRVLTVLFPLVLVMPAFLPAQPKSLGKNPGDIKGRWLKLEDVAELQGVEGVYLGDVTADIQWKKEQNEAPIDEDLLVESIRKQLGEQLEKTRALGKLLDAAPAEGEGPYVRLDCDLTVEPGSRAARYVVGFGAGKSRSILEIHVRDHATGKDLGLYHGYGVGSGMGFKLAGGSARKMTEDDIQENVKKFAELMLQAR